MSFFKFKVSKNIKGSSALLIVLGMTALSTGLFYMTGGLITQRSAFKAREWKTAVAKNAALSAYALMEAALRRRQWEPPPDNDCLKSENFDLSGVTPEGAEYEIKGTFDPRVQMIVLDATATYQGVTQQFRKTLKTLDASDFLVFSKSTDPVTFNRHYSNKKSAGIIAKDRRVYYEGPVEMKSSHYGGGSPQSWTAPRVPSLPQELGLIFQGERMQFLGGIRYPTVGFSLPVAPAYATLRAMLTPLTSYDATSHHGTTVFLKDFNQANSLKQRVTDDILGNITIAEVQSMTYPHALTSGAFPLLGLNDTGTYINDLTKWRQWSYGTSGGGASTIDATCFSVGAKNCTFSKDFPKGFEKWVKDAGLQGVLQTDETEKMSFPPLSWDNFEALEEDARACGVVIDTPSNTYMDCDLSDKDKFSAYLASGASPCEAVPTVDLETITDKFNNFNLSTYSDLSKKNRFLRRVVYSKIKLQIDQKSSQGVMLNVPNDDRRKNLSVWFVSEDKYIVKPYQAAQDFDAWIAQLQVNDELRKIAYFNQDEAGVIPGVKMVIMSPEALQVISPFHKEYTFAEVQAAYPVIGGRVSTKIIPGIDYAHQEDDYFKYGVRDLNIGNVTLISNAQSGRASGIALRGVWGGQDTLYSAGQSILRACLFDTPNDPTSRAANFGLDPACPPSQCGSCDCSDTYPRSLVDVTGESDVAWANYYSEAWRDVPNHVGVGGDLLPPKDSRFYSTRGMLTAKMPTWIIPQVLNYQTRASQVAPTIITLTGTKLLTDFDKTKPPGKRDLSDPKYVYQDTYTNRGRIQDDRRVRWNGKFWYQVTGGDYGPDEGVLCDGGITYIGGGGGASYNTVYVNQDRQMFNQESPDDIFFRQLGNLFAVDMPVIEFGEK